MGSGKSRSCCRTDRWVGWMRVHDCPGKILNKQTKNKHASSIPWWTDTQTLSHLHENQDSILTCLGTMLHIWCDHSSYDTIYFQDGNTCSRSKVQIAHGTQVLGQWPFTFKPEFLSPDLSPFVKSQALQNCELQCTWQVCNHQIALG